jgi:hypothetical protein
MTKNKAQREKEKGAVKIALIAAIATSVLLTGVLTMWGKEVSWTPLLAGLMVGILSYAVVAPEY